MSFFPPTAYAGGASLTVTATFTATRRSVHHGTASLAVTAVGHAGPVVAASELSVKCDQIWAATQQHRRDENLIRRTQPVVRIWNAEWELKYLIGDERKASFSFISNDTGPGQLELPFDSPCAQWIHDHQGRIGRGEGRNVAVTVDYCGARWAGIMDKYTVEQSGDGDSRLVVDWSHDYEKLKWRTVWSNSFLPAWFQFPRAWLIAGPITWILKVTLFLQIFREHNPLVQLLDDPFALIDGNLTDWWNDLDQSHWNMVVKPTSFLQALESGVAWGIVIARWSNFHDMAHTMLEDAELSVRCDRWLEGDPPAWPGANLRSGTMVFDIVDKSGIYVGTNNGGTIFDGLTRTVAEFADDFIDSTENVLFDTEIPTDYWQVGYRFTHPQLPYCVYYEDDSSPIQTSQWVNSPAKGVEMATGGHSMPGVNEIISATIQVIFDLLGNLIFLGGLGSIVDSFLKPLYEDCVAGDTIIDGPDGAERIDVLAERGGPFRVWSITPGRDVVPSTAAFAFKKGHTELFRYTLENGCSIKATTQHRWLTPDGWAETGKAVVGTTKVGVQGSTAFSPVVEIEPLGRHDYYDMHVPGLENYLANGIWNHNTILAWWSVRVPSRVAHSGWERLYEYFQQNGGKAYTITSLMVLRAAMWSTKTTISWKVSVLDGMPFLIGDRGVGHYFLDDRVGLVLRGDGTIHMDRARKLDLAWDDENPPEWHINIGDDRIWQDPAQRAWGQIEAIIAGLRDLGVY